MLGLSHSVLSSPCVRQSIFYPGLFIISRFRDMNMSCITPTISRKCYNTSEGVKKFMANIRALQEAAQILGIKENTLRAAALNGRLPAFKSGKIWLVDLDNLEVLAYQHEFSPKERKNKPAESNPASITTVSSN